MTPRELLTDLTARGVVLTRNGDKLGVKALPGTLTADDRANLARFKLALLSLLDPTLPALADFAPTLNDIADGILDKMGLEVAQFDNNLNGWLWQPVIYVRAK